MVCYWCGCLGKSGAPGRLCWIVPDGTWYVWPGHTRHKSPIYISTASQKTSEKVGQTTCNPVWQFNQAFNSTFAESLPARSVNGTSPPSTSSSKLAPNGTLTLGAKHHLFNGNIYIESASVMLGKLSLFRLWERERSKQEVTSLECTEGDLVMWWMGDWDAGACPSNWNPRLRCGEQRFNIFIIFELSDSLGQTHVAFTAFISEQMLTVCFFSGSRGSKANIEAFVRSIMLWCGSLAHGSARAAAAADPELGVYYNICWLWLPEWSLYEVKLIFAIIPSKEETTDLSSATELLKQWVKNQMHTNPMCTYSVATNS